jgi:GTP-binding protein
VFGNQTDELPESYRRYLLNAMRRDLNFEPVPIRLEFRGRSNPFDRDRR